MPPPGGSAAASAVLEALSARELISHVAGLFDRVVVACSFQKESSVILDLATSAQADNIEFFTLDTGVLFAETRATWDAFQDHFGVEIDGVAGDGPDELWTTDPDECCRQRKVVPLRERLSGADAWITGVRRDQSSARASTPKIGWDARHGLWKVAPLADWSEPQVWSHIFAEQLPYHSLHDQGYASIGCKPCTRPSDGRDGRWAGFRKTECGLHG